METPLATASSASASASTPPTSTSTSKQRNSNRRRNNNKELQNDQHHLEGLPTPSEQQARSSSSGRGRGARGGSRGARNGNKPRQNGISTENTSGNAQEAGVTDSASSNSASTAGEHPHPTQPARTHNQSHSRSNQSHSSDQQNHHHHPHSHDHSHRKIRGGGGPSAGGGASRRARFQSGTQLSSNTLTPSSTPFVPSESTLLFAPTPSPASQTLLSRLTHELTMSTYECSICYSNLSRTTSIHSCQTCYSSFHLSCISKWASRSVEDSAERARLMATRNPTGTTDPKDLEGHWRCPGCQTQFSGTGSIPKTYRCFCQRVKDPQHRPPATPHSCGQQCARPRPAGCRHACGLACHPGPCPACPVVMEMGCHCGKEARLSVRCSAVNPASHAEGGTTRDKLLSCGKVCGRSLKCGMHTCERECHEGACDDCEKVREKKCFCGKESVVESCGKMEGRGEKVPCFTPGDVEGKKWMGEWNCRNTCEAPYDCSHHSCTLPCHPHLSSAPLPCPFSPSLLTHCPCSRTLLTELLPTPRTSCTSPVPTCTSRCGKIHPCGHSCSRKCHLGDCGDCLEEVAVVCRCGSMKAVKKCADRELGDEFLCEKVCRAVRACGRHACGRKCCPLAYQEALLGKGKSKRRPLTEVFEVAGENDPEGFHICERICGRKLNCGIHNCEMNDHKGPCPPCLRAGFEELVCHCGSTVLLPPIACNTVIDCRHPCIRESPCGHPQMQHACHEDPVCPPCPFLMTRYCACGKKAVGNVRCSQDPKKISCGTPCGKLLRCAFHRCRKTCHPPGEPCETCDQVCLKPRHLCGHPCAENCHFPSTCPVDEAHPCPKLIEVTCACGNLKQSARCATSTVRPEGNRDRLVKCTDACALAKRNAALANALGIENKEPKVKEVVYEPQTLAFYTNNVVWCNSIEATFVEFVKGDKQTHHFPPMKRPQRQFTYELCEAFDIRGESLDEEPRRSVMIHRQSNTAIPTPNLADALASQRKSSAAILSFGSVRKALPERKLNNAIILEGVLGFDEEMLREILEPQMRGLAFDLTWIAEDDVLISFKAPPTIALDAKVSVLQEVLSRSTQETGFCASVESVVLENDGKIVRGGWTPVSAASRSQPKPWGSGSTPTFHTNTNAFAALGSGASTASTRTSNPWRSNPASTLVPEVPSPVPSPAPPAAVNAASETNWRAPAPTGIRTEPVPDSWEED
ncbi:hypothetical protein T439DRAFT_313553 [Meredithblackwellia eburnea MCA 4105]